MKIYTLPKNTEITGKILQNLINSNRRAADVKRLQTLAKYYANEAITLRQGEDRPNKLLAITNHARYISKINVGHLLGAPVNYISSEGINIQNLDRAYRKQAIANLDVELASDASIFGQAFERIYANESSEARSVRVNPQNIVLVRDTTVEHNKMFAVIYQDFLNEKGEAVKDKFSVTILTENKIKEGILNGDRLEFARDPKTGEEAFEEHFFGEVPVIEYQNGADRMGDFEPVLPLIDAYNILQSDRILDRERLVDAILAFYGTSFSPEEQRLLKDSRIIANIPEGAKIEYVIKQINEADADVLRATIASDIHKISMTPDMSDQNFAGNSSGVALLYKLHAFEQHIRDKERYFEKSLLERFRIYNAYLASQSKMAKVSTEEIDVTFKRALPQNDYEISQIINNLSGLVDRETLVSQLSFVRDAKETVELAEKEQEQTDAAFAKVEITDQNEVKDAQE